MLYSTLLTAALLPLALALPVAEPEAIASADNVLVKRDTYCGSHYYSDNAIYNAANAACNYVSQGTTAGSSTYPHRYNDYEGFTFDGTPGPYYEFPILSSGKVYSGGSPGADRVIINDNCEIAGEITHTGASSTNGFVACSGTD